MSNIIELSAFKGSHTLKFFEDGEQIARRGASRPYRRSDRNMHNFVFRRKIEAVIDLLLAERDQ